MKAYILKEEDLDTLLSSIDRDPRHGYKGGSSTVLSKEEEQAHIAAHRFFNYQIREWISKIKQ